MDRRTRKYSAFSKCSFIASDIFINTRRMLSSTSANTCSSGSTTSAFAPSRILESTLINIRNPSSSRNTSFVWASWRRIRCISARTFVVSESPRQGRTQIHLLLRPRILCKLEILDRIPHQLYHHISSKILWRELIVVRDGRWKRYRWSSWR
jgi:hypothetical protein